MKRALPFLPLLGLSALGDFLGMYLEGADVLPSGSGFLVSAFCMFILPWMVSAVFAVLAQTNDFRILLFVCTLVAQPVLLFTFVPPGATCETMGVAHRLRREYSPDELRLCADQLRHKWRAGTLTVSVRGKDDHYAVAPTAVVVADSELPASLRGRFQRVFIQKIPDTGDVQVLFALDGARRIICDSRKFVHGFFVYSMADGVHAYRDGRL